MITLITNGIVVTMNAAFDLWPQGYVLICDEKILATGPMEELSARKNVLKQAGLGVDRQVDARRAIVMPGMVNTHTHLGMIPFRGLGDDCRDRLRVFLLPMERQAMSAELAAASARFAIAELLLAGVTCIMDMYYYEGSLAAVMDEMGIRGIAGETVMADETCDFRLPEDALSYGEEQIRRYQDHSRVSCCLAPHAANTCSPDGLQRAHEIDRKYGVPFTLHAAEMDYEMRSMKERYGCSPIVFLDRLGVLDSGTVLAHGIHLDGTDIRTVAERGSGVAHCIGSNTKAAKGVAPVLRLLAAGVPVGLGTDGPASGNTLDLFTQMRFCANFQKNENHDRSAMPARDIVSMATAGGARILGLDAKTGSLEAGKAADLVLVETDSANMFPIYDPYSALVYSANASNVRDVYVAGKQLVKEKRLTEAELPELRRELAARMCETAFSEMGILL